MQTKLAEQRATPVLSVLRVSRSGGASVRVHREEAGGFAAHGSSRCLQRKRNSQAPGKGKTFPQSIIRTERVFLCLHKGLIYLFIHLEMFYFRLAAYLIFKIPFSISSRAHILCLWAQINFR